MNEGLQLRLHGDGDRPTLIYLPGLHGDWTLITRFRHVVEPYVRFAEFTYPRTTTWTLKDHANAVKAELLERGINGGWLLAESFGSQIGWELLEIAGAELRLDGLVLAGGFARHPWPWAAGVAGFVCDRAPLGLVRGVLASYATLARLGDRNDPVLRESTREFLLRRTEEDRRAAAHRLRLIRTADPRLIARRTCIPVYQLCGWFDVTVFWPVVRRWLRLHCPGWRGDSVVTRAEHAVLVTAPIAAAGIVLDWMRLPRRGLKF